MIKTARQLKDLIRNLSREKSADAPQLHSYNYFFRIAIIPEYISITKNAIISGTANYKDIYQEI